MMETENLRFGGRIAAALAAGTALVAYALVPDHPVTEEAGNAPPSASAAAPVVVDTREVRLHEGYVERRTHVGRARPARVSRPGGELGGLIGEYFVDEGDTVREGDGR